MGSEWVFSQSEPWKGKEPLFLGPFRLFLPLLLTGPGGSSLGTEILSDPCKAQALFGSGGNQVLWAEEGCALSTAQVSDSCRSHPATE